MEFTIEAGRPDSIKRKTSGNPGISCYKNLCKSPTMNQETLDIIGRRHTVEETEKAFLLARELRIDNINMDLIVGLPGEDISKVQNTLNRVRALSPDSLTVHSLAVKRRQTRILFRRSIPEMSESVGNYKLTMGATREMEIDPLCTGRKI